MRYTITFFILSISLVLSGFTPMQALSVEYLPTPGETVTTVFQSQDSIPLKYSMESFPKEIYLGDTIYWTIYVENTSPDVVKLSGRSCFPMHEYYPGKFTLSSDLTNQNYRWIAEYPSTIQALRAVCIKDLQPGEKYCDGKHYLEFPPLEDLKEPFWQELSKKMPRGGVICKLRIQHSYGYNDPNLNQPRTVRIEQDILIKPRPINEMALLEKWYKNTPENLFPKIDGSRKVPHNMDLKSSGRSDIVINGVKYDPWLFIRLGNRKPSDPNNPTTLDGWRKLEASLIPGTMRDEVRLTRLQLEYYSAKEGTDTENAKNELVDWLKSLPDPQRTVMATFLVGQMHYFAHSHANRQKPTPLNEKNRELMQAISDLLDDACRKSLNLWLSNYYNPFQDGSLSPPEDEKIIRPFLEIIESIRKAIP